ncbi:helix-turn-helix domain-containing protein [Kineococcus terrestris]|uniref:helix-turn-helix domain-containing protein n=1 Tax=Kineococcus terrestris TaxID=2044856 RepID=UPI0034DB3A48
MDGDRGANLLGEHLRARRELVSPQQVGLPVTGTRRVPGLRREEVAMLAGISAEYYLRLEQGRDRHPSRQVLESLARVLGLADASHLLRLAEATAAPAGRRRRSRPRREVLPASTARLVASLPLPAFAEGRYLDVLAANSLAAAVSPRWVAGRNRLRDVFLDPAEQALFIEAERAAAALVAGFRGSVGTDVDDERVVSLVGELSVASPWFRGLWARHDVAERGGAPVTLDHPRVGQLELEREKLAVSGTDGIVLAVFQPRPGTDAAEKLAVLAAAAPVRGA